MVKGKKTGRRESRGKSGVATAAARDGHEPVGEVWSDRAWVVWVVAGVCWLVYVWYASRAEGVYNDDDLGHYFMARDAWHDPRLFLNVWGRPLFTLVYSLPARLGFDAVQIFSTVVTALAVLVTGWIGRRQPGTGGLAGGLLGTMPFVLLLSTASLTEPLCTLVLALVIDAWTRGRETRAALLAGLIPLARLELVILVGLWACILLARRRWRTALLTGVGLVLWGLVGGLVAGDGLWLWKQVMTGESNLYGATGVWHYPKGLIFVFGPVACLFLLVDLVEQLARRRLGLLQGSILTGLAIYVLLSWRFSLGHSAGFLRHLVALAPLVALGAARGVTSTMRGPRRRPLLVLTLGLIPIALWLSRGLVMHHRPVGPFEWDRLLVAGLCLGLVAAAATVPRVRRYGAVALVGLALCYALHAEPPLPASGEQLTVARVVEWLERSPWRGAPVVVTHPWFEFHLDGAGRRPPGGSPTVGREQVEAAAPETAIIWDSHYSLRASDSMTLADFKFDPRFDMRYEAISPDSSFVIYALIKH